MSFVTGKALWNMVSQFVPQLDSRTSGRVGICTGPRFQAEADAYTIVQEDGFLRRVEILRRETCYSFSEEINMEENFTLRKII